MRSTERKLLIMVCVCVRDSRMRERERESRKLPYTKRGEQILNWCVTERAREIVSEEIVDYCVYEREKRERE